MSKFSDAFSEPMKDIYGDFGCALDGRYTKEEAIKLFAEYAEDHDDHFDPDEVGEGYARFYGDYDDYGEFINGWWWNTYKTGKRGEQKIWISSVPQPPKDKI